MLTDDYSYDIDLTNAPGEQQTNLQEHQQLYS
jgi:hypothetical protein